MSTAACDHPHGQTLETAAQVMFVGCEANATMVSVDLARRTDVLVTDAGAHRVYVAAESGWVSVFHHGRRQPARRGSAHLADGAHSLALNPQSTTATSRSSTAPAEAPCCGNSNQLARNASEPPR